MPKRSLILVSLIFSACAADSSNSPSPGCDGKCDGYGGAEVLAGPESLIDCAVSDDPPYELRCDYTGLPADFPVDVTVNVYAHTRHRDGARQDAEVGFDAVGSQVVFSDLTSDDFPLDLEVDMQLSGDLLDGDIPVAGFESNIEQVLLTQRMNPGDETPQLPLPFELWPVSFSASDAIVGVWSHHDLLLPPWLTYADTDRVRYSMIIPVFSGGAFYDYLLPVSHGATSVTMEAEFWDLDPLQTSIDGPGRYHISPDGFEKLSE